MIRLLTTAELGPGAVELAGGSARGFSRGFSRWKCLRGRWSIVLALWLIAAVTAVGGATGGGQDRDADDDGGEGYSGSADHWAYRPITDPPLPPVSWEEWPQTGIDRFILARLEQRGLRPAGRADRRALARRASFGLVGLPPAPELIDAFRADDSPAAFAALVERLLQSPQYGERWGRHWLDVARYADSNGMDENLAYATAWRYRDYVIAAFNEDRPYDEFIRDQIAGDRFGRGTIGAGGMPRLVGTAFLTIGPKMLAEDDPVKMEMDIIDEQLDTACRVFMGVTMGCARCHDHKFDPVSMKDYYALAGIFKSTRTMENFNVVARWQELPVGSPEQHAELDAHQAVVREQSDRVEAILAEAEQEFLEGSRRKSERYLLAVTELLALEPWLEETRAAPAGAGDDALANPGRARLEIEAEAFARAENLTVYHDRYGEGIGVIAGPGGKTNSVEYELVLPRAGQYRLDLRYTAGNARPVSLSINHEVVKVKAAGGVSGGWNPDTQRWWAEGFFTFRAGTNLVRLERADTFPHIDKLLLVEATPAEVARFAPALPGAKREDDLVPEFIGQWKEYLQKAAKLTNSVMALWHNFDQSCVDPGGTDPSVMKVLLGETNPNSLPELCRRYGDQFIAVEEAWGSPGPTGKGGEDRRLEDPVLEAFRQVTHDPEGPFALPAEVERYYGPEVRAELKQARAKLKKLNDTLPGLPHIMAVKEGQVADLPVHLRGSHLRLGERAARGFPKSLAQVAAAPAIGTNTSGRLEFAEWLTHSDHPLTARVMVNRIWHWHFGEGLVRSPDNFGRLGERPTHPQLLDWLAVRFRESGWSIKAMHRLIMNSAVYQQSVVPVPLGPAAEPLETVDAENRLWSHFNRRRLEVEAIRDAICYVAGNLDLRRPGSLLSVADRRYVTSLKNNHDLSVFEKPVRAVYLPVVRSALYELFQAYDFADPSVMNGDRAQTVAAPQALFMMNSSLMAKQSMELAKLLLAQKGMDDKARVAQLYRRAYGRRPTAPEREASLAYVVEYGGRVAEAGNDRETARVQAWRSLCRAVMSANEFIHVD